MIYTRLVGDVHGIISHQAKGRCYLSLIKKAQYSIQLGDFGFDYRHLENVDATRHKILPGNHEEYNEIDSGKWPHFLSHFGVHKIPLANGEMNFFYIRGGLSVDRQWRIPNRDWFPQEQLNFEQATAAAKLYEEVKPEIVISHECPAEIIELISGNSFKLDPSYTAKLLQACYVFHQPKLWLFGHFHNNIRMHYSGRGVTACGKQIDNGPRNETLFICLNELGYCDFDDKGHMIEGMPQ